MSAESSSASTLHSAPLTKLTRYILTNLSLLSSAPYLLTTSLRDSNHLLDQNLELKHSETNNFETKNLETNIFEAKHSETNNLESTNYKSNQMTNYQNANYNQDNNLLFSTVDSDTRRMASSASFASLVPSTAPEPQPLVASPKYDESNSVTLRGSFLDNEDSVKLDWLISDWSPCSQSCSDHGIQVTLIRTNF